MDLKKSLKRVSIDRVDNDKGYILSNIQLVCQFVNLGKNIHTDKEFKAEIAEVINGRGV